MRPRMTRRIVECRIAMFNRQLGLDPEAANAYRLYGSNNMWRVVVEKGRYGFCDVQPLGTLRETYDLFNAYMNGYSEADRVRNG